MCCLQIVMIMYCWINGDRELPLTQTDVNSAVCYTQNQQGRQAYRRGRYAEALTAFQAALVCYQAVRGDRSGESSVLNNMGVVYEAQQMDSQALESYKKALAIQQATGDRLGESTSHYNIGLIYQAQTRYSEALNSFKQALTIQREVGDRSGEGSTLNNIGGVYHAQGRYREALDSYEQSLTIVREVGDRASEGTTRNSLGAVYQVQGRYSDALDSYEQALKIRQEVGDRVGEGITLNNMGVVYEAQARYAKALDCYERVMVIQREVGDHKGQGVTLSNSGVVYAAQSRYDKALDNYEQALTLHRKVGDRVGEGRTLNNIGLLYKVKTRYSEALNSFEQALTIQQQIGDRAAEGATLNNIGAMYDDQGKHGEALDRYEQALAIRQEVGDQDGKGATLSNIGVVYTAQGRYREALDIYKQALAIQQAVGIRDGEGSTLQNIGAVYESQGQYGEALDIYEQALAIQREIGDRDGEGVTLSNIGVVYTAQGRYGEALDIYKQALAIQREIGDRDGEGVTLSNVGVVYKAQGRYHEALGSYKEALVIMQEVGDRVGEGRALSNIGVVYDDQGKHGEALDLYEQALEIRQEVGDRSGECVTLNNIGAVYKAQGRYHEALGSYEEALALARKLGDRAHEGTILNNIGVIYEAQGRYRETVYAFVRGIEVIEGIRTNAGNDQARASFVDNYATIYDRLVALYHQQGTVEQAFGYSERGRARSLLDIMSTGHVSLRDNESAELSAQEVEAYAARQSAQDALAKARAAEPPDPAWVKEAEKTLKEAEAAYESVLDAIAARSDQLASLIPGRQKVLQLAEVQVLLDKDTTMLSYWMLEDKALAFVVTGKDAKIVELPNVTAKSILAATESLYQWNNSDNPHPRPLRDLYQWLIAPLSDTLKTPQIAIIPHQQLHYVPFAALVDDSHDKQYFGQQYVLSVLPSANLLPYLMKNAETAQANVDGSALVFGNPTTSEPDLKALKYAESEAEAISAFFGVPSYLSHAATEQRLWQQSEQARIVHLAAHGGYNQNNALYSAIYLAGEDQYDGRLETHEIFGLPLQGNDLVVLSACQTNVGDLSRGDELVGLTRAFFFAGSPTVISSLWNVDDAATETLMVSFYTHWLKDGMSKAEALQAAQADVRVDSRWVSPFYWAAFALNGHPGVHR